MVASGADALLVSFRDALRRARSLCCFCGGRAVPRALSVKGASDRVPERLLPASDRLSTRTSDWWGGGTTYTPVTRIKGEARPFTVNPLDTPVSFQIIGNWPCQYLQKNLSTGIAPFALNTPQKVDRMADFNFVEVGCVYRLKRLGDNAQKEWNDD